eukprot:CAMPEP_0203926358 /NCGR_PEP_ID=MMETSP0359-20131031/65883_1 /ASSEMBLY_ACC=CAM_ASM_000338 /TAXON_ID=268821 /ORGANISM="Scrippsiella Hangoei, Strain SHTV-5" /LENGTH=111 /DNA_ID=CAMNT_0050854943 /DNA_START=58 /DNA_END=389 /DNA_ORIENTATION=+
MASASSKWSLALRGRGEPMRVDLDVDASGAAEACNGEGRRSAADVDAGHDVSEDAGAAATEAPLVEVIGGATAGVWFRPARPSRSARPEDADASDEAMVRLSSSALCLGIP